MLQLYYQTLLRHFQDKLDLEHWWPARSRFEMIIGSLLVQNTNWRNAQLALSSLRRAGRITPARIANLPLVRLGRLIRSAGSWRNKAINLRGLAFWLESEHGGSLRRAFNQPTETLRSQLLSLRGVGPETADAILLFAAKRPSFVIDAYTRRVFGRHYLWNTDGDPRQWIQNELSRSWPGIPERTAARIYSNYHAMLVETGKRYCRKHSPKCTLCPLREFLPV